MICKKCGRQIPDDALFCEECGEKTEPVSGLGSADPILSESDPVQEKSGRPVGGSGNIILCDDGKYRWYYEYPMLKNPTILFTIWNVMFLASLAPALVSMISVLTAGDGFLEALKTFGITLGICFGIMFVLSIVSYFILAAYYGFKYIVLFEMDDQTLTHRQENRQFKKAQAISWLSAYTGAAGNSLSGTGAGLLAASKDSTTSEFKNVEKVIGLKRNNTIKVNQLFAKNQVYVYKEDYDFVWNYITSRCKKAKIK